MIAATAGLMLTGCNKDDGADTAISHFPEDGVIRVTTNVNEAVLTRAGLTSNNVSNFWLKIVTGDGNGGYNYFEKITKNSSSGEWESANSMLWKDATTLTQMTAVVFGNRDFTDDEVAGGVNLTLPEDQSAENGSGIEAADLLVMRETTVNPASDLDNEGKVSITLSHALTKIDVTLTLGNEFEKSGLNKATDLTDFVVSSKGSFAFNAREGYVADLHDGDVNVKACRNSFVQAAKSVANYECIVVPYSNTKLTVSFKIGEKNYSWTSAEVPLEQGYKYAIALTVGDDVVTIAPNGITASPWTPQSGTPTDINTH